MTLDHVLDSLDVALEPFALCEIRGDASLGLGCRSHAVLHYGLAGRGSITVDGNPPIAAAAGTMILVPAFSPHSLHASGNGAGSLPDCRPIDLSLEHLRAGAGPGAFAAICGRVSVVYRGLSGTMDLLRAPIVEHLGPSDRLRAALDELVTELAVPAIGTRALAKSLLLQAVILLFRRRFEVGDAALTWMRGLADEALWEPLRQMLDHPERPHTVESLADCAGMSRATFAGRFSEAHGSGPIELLRVIRLRRAAELLTMSNLPVKRIARMVGYESRTYFSRAFRDRHGLAPDAFRAAAGSSDAPSPGAAA